MPRHPALGVEVFFVNDFFKSYEVTADIHVNVPCGFEYAYASISWGEISDFRGMCAGVVTVVADPEEGGTVTGGGYFEEGSFCSVAAVANDGYTFEHWELNDGIVVSNTANYTFVVCGDMSLAAHFVSNNNIAFADANVKSICINHWDTNNDGELSYEEAASVTDLGDFFQFNYQITSFNELQYFTGLSSIGNDAFYGCTRLFSIVFPNTITSIGNSAFSGCSGFTGPLTLPNSVTSIGNSAFSGCSGFTGPLTLPNSVTSIGDHAFFYCSGFTGSLTLPNSVTLIGDYAFYGCRGFTGSLTLPNFVTSIGDYAFSGCSGFTGSLTLPNFVTSIGNHAFSGCSGFTGSLTLPNYLTSIGYHAFYGCSGFTGSLALPNYLTSIGNYAFYECSGFTGSLTLPNFLSSIGNGVFYKCSGFTGSLTIPNSLTSIGNYAFYECSGFTGSLALPNSVISIGDHAFYGCSGLTGSLTIPNSLTSIGNSAFIGCSSLSQIVVESDNPIYDSRDNCNALIETSTNTLMVGCKNTIIPGSVTSIGNSAFYGCTGLTGSLTIPNSVTSIGITAFGNCTGLAGILTIGNSVTTIGTNAFYGCSGFTSMIVLAEIPPTVGSSLGTSNNIPTIIPVFVPCESVETYQSAEGWNAFSNILCISSGIVSVAADPIEGGEVSGAGTFEGGELCTVVATPNEGYCFANWTIDDHVVSLDANYTFVVASDHLLTAHFVMDENIDFVDANVKAICVANWDTNGDGELSYAEAALVTSFGEVFTGNADITSFEELQYFISLTNISNNAFENCSGLTGSLTIPNSVTMIGISAFSNCSGFTGSLTIPNSVYMIDRRAFINCSGFTGSLTIGNSVTTIGEAAFYGCTGFTGSLSIPNSVTTIGGGAFRDCTGLTGSLSIPNSVAEISSSAFQGCSGFTGSLTFGNSVTSIGRQAFYGCSGFSGTLTISNSVTYIGDNAFSGCSGFTGSLAIPDSVTTIGDWAFGNCSGFTGNLTIGHSVTSIGYCAFYNCSGLTGDLVIPNSVTRIGGSAFNNCSGLTGDLVIPNSVTSIGSSAFRNCSGLTGSLTIPNSVTSMGEYAFSGCSGFTGNLTIPNSVTIIDYSAFSGCSGLTGTLTIPNSVTSIGQSAFMNCSGLSDVMLLGTTPPTLLGNYTFNGSVCPIYVPYESLNDYKTAANWSSYQSRIFPMTYTTIAGYNEGGGWAFIASPLTEDKTPTTVNNMLSGANYDLYQFNQSATDEEWQNYKADNFSLVNGKGYLYANDVEVNVIFKGEFNEDEIKMVSLDYDTEKANAGWNLVGNPFPVCAYIDRPYYMMNEDGTAIEPVAVSSSTAISPCTGIMVKAEATDETVTFTRTSAKTTSSRGNLQITVSEAPSEAVVDKAILSFTPGDELEKYVFNKSTSQLYLQQNGKDYAVACANGAGELPVCFKASQDGSYTLRISKANKEFTYLHLIDTVNSVDIDLLQQPSYSFESMTTDVTNRFKLIFK